MPKTDMKWRGILFLAGLIGAVLAGGCASGSNSPVPAEERSRETPTVAVGTEAANQERLVAVAEDAEVANQEQLVPVVLPQTTAVYFRTRGGARSDTLKAIVSSPTGEMLGSEFIQIESTSSALVLYSPDSGEATVFHTYSSPSWSKRTKHPLTIDDRLYLETEYENGSLNLVEFDPSTLSRGGSSDTELLRAAVIGDTHYYYKYPEYRDFLGYYGYLEFVKEPVSGGEDTRRKLRPPDAYRDDPDFPFKLVAVGQTL